MYLRDPITGALNRDGKYIESISSVMIYRDPNDEQDIRFETIYHHEGTLRIGINVLFDAFNRSFDFTKEEMEFILESKPGQCGNIRVLLDQKTQSAIIESVDGPPSTSRVSFPMECYTKLSQAIRESLKVHDVVTYFTEPDQYGVLARQLNEHLIVRKNNE